MTLARHLISWHPIHRDQGFVVGLDVNAPDPALQAVVRVFGVPYLVLRILAPKTAVFGPVVVLSSIDGLEEPFDWLN